jgi:hypothetical protein
MAVHEMREMIRTEPQNAGLAWKPQFEMTTAEAVELVRQREEFLRQVLKPGVDYGIIPGTKEPSLWKPGAEKSLRAFGLNTEIVNDRDPVVDLVGADEHGGEPFVMYDMRCNVYRQIGPEPDQRMLVASATGSCNSWEKKYRYRDAHRKCPMCEAEAIIKGKEEFGGGWLCWKKRDGCGATFAEDALEIVGQEVGRVPNPDVAELVNTIEKMAAKRALVAATLLATGFSDFMTQDMEDAEPEAPAAPRGGRSSARPAPAVVEDDGFRAAPAAQQHISAGWAKLREVLVKLREADKLPAFFAEAGVEHLNAEVFDEMDADQQGKLQVKALAVLHGTIAKSGGLV